jgi:hypothetical protein
MESVVECDLSVDLTQRGSGGPSQHEQQRVQLTVAEGLTRTQLHSATEGCQQACIELCAGVIRRAAPPVAPGDHLPRASRVGLRRKRSIVCRLWRPYCYGDTIGYRAYNGNAARGQK